MKRFRLRKIFQLLAIGVMMIFVGPSFTANVKAQVTLTTGAVVEVRSGPSPRRPLIDTLPVGQQVILESPEGRRNFFRIRYNGDKTGWALGDYLLVPDVEAMDTTPENVMLTTRRAMFPCGTEVHYRWKQKVTTSGFAPEPRGVSVRALLNWPAAAFRGRGVSSWCKDRVGREVNSYSVVGFVRRTRTEADGDVHIEITQQASDAEEDCMVVEIPAAHVSPRFRRARTDLARLLSVTTISNKDFTAPLRVRFYGLAFWDGWHAGADVPSGHGRCNSTAGAAWELHPVYKVSAP